MNHQSFFDKITVPAKWKYLGRKDIGNCIGVVLQISYDVSVRVYYLGKDKGGIVEKRYDDKIRNFRYTCVIDNKRAEELNEFINNKYLKQ